MAKILFVPDWLDELIKESGSTYEQFADDINSVITSKVDVINYYIAQYEMFKFLTGANDAHSKYYSMYKNVFWHDFPVMPELTIELNKRNDLDISYTSIVTTAQKAEDIHLNYVADKSNRYVIVTSSHIKCDVVNKNCTRQSIIWNVLQNSHNALRVMGQVADKSAVFRNNSVLTTLYVEQLV